MRRILSITILLLVLALASACSSREDTGAATMPEPEGTSLSSTSATPLPLPSSTLPPSDSPTATATATWVPTVTPRPTVPPATPAPELLATMDAIASEVEDLRGLTQSSPITRIVMTRAELAAYLEDKLAEEYSPEEVRKDTLVLAAFDFVPIDYDLRQVLLDLYSAEILGLYDDELDTFYIVSDGDFSLVDQLTVAHEYVHALQDQHFGLEAFVDDQRLSDDEVLAHMALVEGDASLAMTDYLLARLSEVSADDLASLLEEGAGAGEQVLSGVPPIIRETFNFPYIYGLEFVSRLQEQGWEAVDTAFVDPPQSTEQILHPERYLTRDEPQILALPPLTGTLGTGWKLLEAETLGEFQTGLYLAQQVDQETADVASQGWDGDQYAVYAQDGTTMLAFSTAWDSPKDREEFVASYQQYATEKYGQGPVQPGETEVWWETPEQTTVITWEENTALIVVGPDPETVARVLAVTGS